MNHEMSRELLWNQFPTDLRSSYFRKFWNMELNPDDSNFNPEDVKHIKQLHSWGSDSIDTNQSPDESSSVLVLVIKAELLRRYPNVEIFAQEASWAEEGGQPQYDINRGH